MYVDVCKNRTVIANAKTLADTGCSRSIIAYRLIKNKIQIKKTPTEKIIAANGSEMDCKGVILVKLRYQGRAFWITPLVSDDLKEDLLLSLMDLKKMGIIPPNFPSLNYNRVNRTEGQVFEQSVSALVAKYEDVFNQEKVTPIKGPPAEIILDREKEGYKPLHITTARPIPHHYQEAAAKCIKLFVDSGVLEKVPDQEVNEWQAAGFFVPKPNGDVRLVTDFSVINKYIRRNIHPFPSPRDVIKAVKPTSKYFLKFDATQGYYQIPLTKEASKLTTFLLPSGRYRFTRAPMGINNSSDTFCAKTDQIFQTVPDLIKIVDDGLIQGETQEEVLQKFETALQACRENNLTLAAKKLEYGTQVNFGGYIIGRSGVRPDPKKVQAIKDFPRPKDITSLRSFLGLANQLAFFVPDFAHTTSPMRDLLKKNTVYQWLPEHETAFQETKDMLLSTLIVKPFTTAYKTELLCDASRLHGLGYILIQRDPDDPEQRPRLIQCGSRALIPAETRYATNELEATAMQWSILDCKHYLLGCDFTVISDHRPLEGSFTKHLSDITNARILRVREKLANFSFTVKWTPGKLNLAADALSRIPRFTPSETAQQTGTWDNIKQWCKTHICCCTTEGDGEDLDPLLQDLNRTAQEDEEYSQIYKALKTNKQVENLPPNHPARQYKNVWHDLSLYASLVILEGQRIVVPRASRQKILSLLHQAHAGIQRTREQAKRHYYWPGMSSAVKQIIELCDDCQALRPSKPKEKLQPYQTCQEPMHGLSADLFEDKGYHYLVIVDRYSGYPFPFKLKSNQLTTGAIIAKFEHVFKHYGKPVNITTDNGPQFRDEFKAWCTENDITLIHSSPYNHQSNATAEAAVKNCEYLLRKCNYDGKEFERRLTYWRNTPSTNSSKSPSEKFFGRNWRTSMPIIHGKSIKLSTPRQQMDPENTPILAVGDLVRVQNPITGRWDETATIAKLEDSGRSYALIKDGSKKPIIRNRRFLKLLRRTPQKTKTARTNIVRIQLRKGFQALKNSSNSGKGNKMKAIKQN